MLILINFFKTNCRSASRSWRITQSAVSLNAKTICARRLQRNSPLRHSNDAQSCVIVERQSIQIGAVTDLKRADVGLMFLFLLACHFKSCAFLLAFLPERIAANRLAAEQKKSDCLLPKCFNLYSMFARKVSSSFIAKLLNICIFFILALWSMWSSLT